MRRSLSTNTNHSTPIDTSGHNSVGPWPVNFRGIGGHLIRPRAAPIPAADAPVVPADWLDTHGEYLLAPILETDGARTAVCPVCVTAAPLPSEGGWIEVRCAACGTDFVASDGSPPPVVVRPAEPVAPARHSPLAPPPADWVPLPPEPRGFTDDVYIDPTGRRFVHCPQCRAAEIDVPTDAWLAVTLRCGACHKPVMVNLSGEPTPVGPSGRPAPAPIHDPYRKFYSRCPNCGVAALTPHRTDDHRALICTACGQRIVVSEGRRAPMLPLLPAPPSVWDRVRRWLRGE